MRIYECMRMLRKGIGSATVQHAFRFAVLVAKVHEEAEFDVCRTEVSLRLVVVFLCEESFRFQFHDHLLFHEKINSIPPGSLIS